MDYSVLWFDRLVPAFEWKLLPAFSGWSRRLVMKRKGACSSKMFVPVYQSILSECCSKISIVHQFNIILCSLSLRFLRNICAFLKIKPTRCTNFSNLFLEWNSACFRLFFCPTSGVFHCTHSNGICHTGDSLWAGTFAPAHKLSANLYDVYHCCVYSEKLLMMDRGTVQNV